MKGNCNFDTNWSLDVKTEVFNVNVNLFLFIPNLDNKKGTNRPDFFRFIPTWEVAFFADLVKASVLITFFDVRHLLSDINPDRNVNLIYS